MQDIFVEPPMVPAPPREVFVQTLSDFVYYTSEGLNDLSDDDVRKLMRHVSRAVSRIDGEYNRRFRSENSLW